jgi:amino-acid N-acetyltransferase
MKEYSIRRANASDIAEIKETLTAGGLPTVGVDKAVEQFLVAEGSQVIGVLGALYDTPKALLRSFAVSPAQRSKGVGGTLVVEIFKELQRQEIEEVYLITDTAAEYFRRVGFYEITRAEMPANLLKESGLDEACPCSSKCMKYLLE